MSGKRGMVAHVVDLYVFVAKVKVFQCVDVRRREDNNEVGEDAGGPRESARSM